RLGQRARRPLRHGAALLPRSSQNPGGVRAGAVPEDRARAHLSPRPAAPQTCRNLARPAALALGAPPGSARRLSHGTQGDANMTASRWQPDPKLDLVLDRTIDVPPELVWEAWTKPEHLKK